MSRILEVVVKVKDQASGKLSKFSGNVKGSTKAIKAMAAAAAVGAVVLVAAFVKMLDATKKQVLAAVKLGDEYDKMGKRIDVSTEALSEWVFIIERAGGSSATLEAAFKGLITQMKGVKDGTKLSVDAFADLGVEVFDASGEMRKAEDVFNDAARAISGLSSTSEQAAYSQQLFGKGGMKLIPVLRQTSDELDHQRELAEKLGLVYSKEFTDAAAEMNDALDLLRKGTGAFGRELVLTFGSDSAALIEELAFQMSELFNLFDIEGADASDIMLDIAVSLDAILSSLGPAMAGLNAIKQLGDLTTSLVPGPAMVKATWDAIKTGGGSAKEAINEAAEAIKFFQLLLEDHVNGTDESTDRFVAALLARRKAIKDAREDTDTGGDGDKPEPIVLPVVFEMQPEDLPGIDDALFAELDLLSEKRRAAAEEEMIFGLATKDRYDDEIAAVEEITRAEEELYDQAVSAAEAVGRIGETTAQALLRGENTMKAFASAIRNEVINAISAAIAKMIALKALMFFSGLDIFGGVKDGGTIPQLAAGGSIPGAAFGYAVPDGPRGRDSVLINAMPGEEVINRGLSQRLASYLAARESSAMADPATLSSGRGGITSVSLNIARPVGYLDLLDLGDAAVYAGEKLEEANL